MYLPCAVDDEDEKDDILLDIRLDEDKDEEEEEDDRDEMDIHISMEVAAMDAVVVPVGHDWHC